MVMFLSTLFASSKPKPVPQSVRTSLREKLGIDGVQLDSLQAVERSGPYAGRRVRYIRIFDPAKLNGGAAKVNYRALDANKAAVLFEGHVEKNGAIVISDRRPPVRKAS